MSLAALTWSTIASSAVTSPNSRQQNHNVTTAEMKIKEESPKTRHLTVRKSLAHVRKSGYSPLKNTNARMCHVHRKLPMAYVSCVEKVYVASSWII